MGTLTARAILGIDFLMKYNGIVDVGKVQLILGKAAPFELHRDSRQTQESISVHLEESFRLPPFLEQMVLATFQGSVPGEPYFLECNEKKMLPCVVAQVLVQPKVGRMPIQLLNFKSEYVTILSRVELAILESTEPPPKEAYSCVKTG